MSDKASDGLLGQVLIAEKAERYGDMFESMVELIKVSPVLDEERRNLFSIACKNLVGPKRSSCRCLCMMEEKYSAEPKYLECVKELKARVAEEVTSTCSTLVSIITGTIMLQDISVGEKVYYKKMCGDYYRYMAEVEEESGREQASKKALEMYLEARELAFQELSPTNTVRLGLLLNLSVFYYEIHDDVANARKIAEEALRGALAEIGDNVDSTGRDCELILQLLRDNLTLWSVESPVNVPPSTEDSSQNFLEEARI